MIWFLVHAPAWFVVTTFVAALVLGLLLAWI